MSLEKLPPKKKDGQTPLGGSPIGNEYVFDESTFTVRRTVTFLDQKTHTFASIKSRLRAMERAANHKDIDFKITINRPRRWDKQHLSLLEEEVGKEVFMDALQRPEGKRFRRQSCHCSECSGKTPLEEKAQNVFLYKLGKGEEANRMVAIPNRTLQKGKRVGREAGRGSMIDIASINNQRAMRLIGARRLTLRSPSHLLSEVIQSTLAEANSAGMKKRTFAPTPTTFEDFAQRMGLSTGEIGEQVQNANREVVVPRLSLMSKHKKNARSEVLVSKSNEMKGQSLTARTSLDVRPKVRIVPPQRTRLKQNEEIDVQSELGRAMKMYNITPMKEVGISPSQFLSTPTTMTARSYNNDRKLSEVQILSMKEWREQMYPEKMKKPKIFKAGMKKAMACYDQPYLPIVVNNFRKY